MGTDEGTSAQWVFPSPPVQGLGVEDGADSCWRVGYRPFPILKTNTLAQLNSITLHVERISNGFILHTGSKRVYCVNAKEVSKQIIVALVEVRLEES